MKPQIGETIALFRIEPCVAVNINWEAYLTAWDKVKTRTSPLRPFFRLGIAFGLDTCDRRSYYTPSYTLKILLDPHSLSRRPYCAGVGGLSTALGVVS